MGHRRLGAAKWDCKRARVRRFASLFPRTPYRMNLDRSTARNVRWAIAGRICSLRQLMNTRGRTSRNLAMQFSMDVPPRRQQRPDLRLRWLKMNRLPSLALGPSDTQFHCQARDSESLHRFCRMALGSGESCPPSSWTIIFTSAFSSLLSASSASSSSSFIRIFLSRWSFQVSLSITANMSVASCYSGYRCDRVRGAWLVQPTFPHEFKQRLDTCAPFPEQSGLGAYLPQFLIRHFFPHFRCSMKF